MTNEPQAAPFIEYLKQSWQLSKHSTKAYKVAMLIMIVTITFSNVTLLSSFKTAEQAYFSKYLLRSFIDLALFILVCHFVLRPYLKLRIIHRPIGFKSIISLLAFLLLCSIFSYFGSMGISAIPLFADTDIQKMQLVNDQGQVDAIFSEAMIWFITIFNAFCIMLGWAILYISWHQHQAKKQLQKQVQVAQMQQLTNQLSPHFLFNTFNSIRALIYEDQDKAADTVTELSELFRTHLQAHLRVSSTLEEEWQVSERYLGIEQIRLEERLKVKTDIDSDLSAESLPTLTLLTLIENAIKHGISPNSEPGFIHIQAHNHNPQRWNLTVSNSFKPGSDTSGTRVGLANVESRLRLTYGEDFNLNQHSDDQQFTVSLDLPRQAS